MPSAKGHADSAVPVGANAILGGEELQFSPPRGSFALCLAVLESFRLSLHMQVVEAHLPVFPREQQLQLTSLTAALCSPQVKRSKSAEAG